jgi:hypothetical protein
MPFVSMPDPELASKPDPDRIRKKPFRIPNKAVILCALRHANDKDYYDIN